MSAHDHWYARSAPYHRRLQKSQHHRDRRRIMKLSLRKCTAGAVGVVTAIVLPILLGFGSLGVEVGHWYLAERQMQGAADAAAMSAAAQSIQDQIAGNT